MIDTINPCTLLINGNPAPRPFRNRKSPRLLVVDTSDSMLAGLWIQNIAKSFSDGTTKFMSWTRNCMSHALRDVVASSSTFRTPTYA